MNTEKTVYSARVTTWALLASLLLTCVSVGGSVAPEDATGSSAANPLYFREFLKKPWSQQNCQYRVPVLISEQAGLQRFKAPVTITREFSRDIKASSIRVVTAWGEEIPSQARLLDAKKNLIEVFFLCNLPASGYLPVFVYCDDSDKVKANGGLISDLVLQDLPDENLFVLANANMLLKLRKNMPGIVYIEPRESSTGSLLYDDAGLSPEGWYRVADGVGFDSGRVLDDGPLKKVIEYSGVRTNDTTRITVTFTLVSGAKRLDYSVASDKPASIPAGGNWLPGTGLKAGSPDRLYYAGSNGVEFIKIATPGWVVENNLKTSMKEGWFAYYNPGSGETVGEILDLKTMGRLRIYAHGSMGYCSTIYSKIPFPMSLKRGIVPLRDNSEWRTVRDEYLAFKNPPEINVAPVQRKQDVPWQWQVPVFGKDQIRSYHQSFKHWLGKKVDLDPEKVLAYLIRTLKAGSANYVSMWPYGPMWPGDDRDEYEMSFFKPMIEMAHKAGMGVETCMFRVHNPDLLKQMAQYDVDMCLLHDEACFIISDKDEVNKKRFVDTYKMPFPEPWDASRLAEPAFHNRALLQVELYTEFLQKKADAIREVNKKMILGDQVNSGGISTPQGPHDWDSQSDILDTVSLDLYGKPIPAWKYLVKFMRGSFGNNRPIILYWGCDPDAETVRPNCDGLLMWGVDGLFYFPPGSLYLGADAEVKRNYRRLDYTGLGNMIAEYEPVKSVAFLWDRAGLNHSIKNGLWTTVGSVYTGRIRNMIFINNIQSDIVTAKYLEMPALKEYHLLVVANDPELSDKHAGVIEAYVKAGGTVIIEGETINNKLIQKLAGVSGQAVLSKIEGEVKGERPFSFKGSAVSVKTDGAKTVCSFENGDPVLFSNKLGEGTVFYTPLILSEKAGFQEDIAEFLKGLIKDNAGTLPVSVSDDSGAVDTNLSSKKGNYLLVLWNKSSSEKNVSINLNSKVMPEVLVDFTEGTTVNCAKTNHVSIPPRTFKYMYLGADKEVALPELARLRMRGMQGYSSFPREDVIDISTAGSESDEDAKLRKRKKAEGISYIGILSDKGREDSSTKSRVKGDEGIFEALQDRRGIVAELVFNLSPATLDFYDAIIVPRIGHRTRPSVLKKGWETALREYVENGGAAMLCGHSVGMNVCEFPPFPEVGKTTGGYVESIRDLRVEREHPITTAESMQKRFPKLYGDKAFHAQFEETVMKVGDTFQFSFPDYLPLVPGKNGVVIADATMKNGLGGEPVIIAGKFGKGRVVLSGIAIGSRNTDDENTTRGEKNILVNAAYWLVQPEK